MRHVTILLIGLFLTIITDQLFGLIISVPSDQPTIQAGINASVDGDTVLVAPGTYTGTGNKDIYFQGKAILVTSEMGPDSTILDGDFSGYHKGFIFEYNETQSSMLRGFTITHLFHALYIIGSSPFIEDCRIIENGHIYYGPEGHGIYMEYSSPKLLDCAIVNNFGRFVGAVWSFNSDPLVINSVFYGNWPDDSDRSTIAIYGGNPVFINSIFHDNYFYVIEVLEGDGPTIRNCIFWNSFWGPINGPAEVTYSDMEGGWPGEGNIDEDPLFVDAENHDYGLLPGSPCIDTGDPYSSNVPWGGFRRDMGAFEFDQGFYFDGQNTILKPFPIEPPNLATK